MMIDLFVKMQIEIVSEVSNQLMEEIKKNGMKTKIEKDAYDALSDFVFAGENIENISQGELDDLLKKVQDVQMRLDFIYNANKNLN